MYELQFDLCKKCKHVNICYGEMHMLRHTKDELTIYNTCHHYYNPEEINVKDFESPKIN
jgi:hypothetical protein